MTSKWRSTAPVNIKWRGGTLQFVGAAAVEFEVPDEMRDEIEADFASTIPGFEWTTTDSVASHAIAGHTATGLTSGHVLAASGASSYGFSAITASQISQVYSSALSGSLGPFIFADQYSSIQAAHDALPAAGGTIVVPAGTYLTSGTSPVLSVTKSNFRLLGAGRGATIFAFANSQASYLVAGGDGGLHDITVEGIEFDGRNLHPNGASPTVVAIQFANTGTHRITIRDCYIHDMPGNNETFAINFGNLTSGVISGVYVSNCRGSGIALSGATAVTISDCIADACGWMGFTISSNDASDSMSREITITNCVARNNALYGFNVESTEHSSLSNLVAKGNGRWGFAFASSGVAGVPYSRYITGSGLIAVNNSSASAGQYDGIIFSGNGTAGTSNINLTGVICYDGRTSKFQKYGVSSSGGTADNTVSGDLRGNLTGEVDFTNGTNNQYRPSRNISAQVTLSAVVSLNHDSTTMIPWNTETSDTEALHSNATNPSRFTIPTGLAGQWKISANILYASNSAGDRISRIYKNGSTILSEDSGAPSAQNNRLSRYLEWEGALVAGDYVEAAAHQTSGGALDLQSTSWFAARRV